MRAEFGLRPGSASSIEISILAFPARRRRFRCGRGPVARELKSAARARRGCIGPTLFDQRCGGVVVTLLTRAPFISVKHTKA